MAKREKSIKRFQSMDSQEDQRKFTRTVSDRRTAWTTLNGISFIEYNSAGDFAGSLPDQANDLREEYINSFDPDEEEVSVWISARATTFVLRLSNFTHDELVILSRFLNNAIEKAAKVALARDDALQGAYDDYDYDSNMRLYRAVPEYFIRKRKVPEHDQSVRGGPPRNVPIYQQRERFVPGIRVPGGSVVERDERGSVPSDDEETTGDREGIRADDIPF